MYNIFKLFSGDNSTREDSSISNWISEMEITVASYRNKGDISFDKIVDRNSGGDAESRTKSLVKEILQIEDLDDRSCVIYMMTTHFDVLSRDNQIALIDESIRIFAEAGKDLDSELASVAACIMTNLERYFLPEHLFDLLGIVEKNPRLMSILYRSHNFLSHSLPARLAS